jgi:rod shape determining protein RodA
MRPWYKQLDLFTLVVWALLVSVGLAAIYSATHGIAREFLLDSVQQNFNRQLRWFGASVLVMGTILLMPAPFLRRMAPVAYLGGIGLLVAALLFGNVINGAKAWVWGVQPGEVAKVGTVLAVAVLLSTKEARRGSVLHLVGAAVLLLIPVGLLLAANDTGTGLVYLGLIPVMLFWSGAVPLPVMALGVGAAVSVYLVIVNPWYAAVFAVLATVGMLFWTQKRGMAGLMMLASGGIATAAYVGLFKILQPHQIARIVAFNDPESFRLGAGFHIIQAKAAIGSGGLFGKGFAQGTQTQLAYIPENSTDFIFCVIGEEFGFLGTMGLLTLFAVLLIRLGGLGVQTGFSLPRLFIAGITGIYLVHILINVGMTIGLMPVIGIPLPFISYGGSALLANTAMLAIALNFHARRDEFAVYRAE